MKLCYQISKVLLVVVALCFFFIVVPGRELSANGKNNHTVLYDKNDCNGKLFIKEEGRAIYVRSKEHAANEYAVLKYQTAEFHPMTKMFIE